MPPLPEATEGVINGAEDFIPELYDEGVQGDYQDDRHYCTYHGCKAGNDSNKAVNYIRYLSPVYLSC